MAVMNYFSVDGLIEGEATSGIYTDYLSDALGSVTATANSGAAILNTYRHKPYGARLSKTGAGADPVFLWTGTTGSKSTDRTFSHQYNLTRHFSNSTASWSTVDDLWPTQHAYAYVGGKPTLLIDPSGMACCLLATKTVAIQFYCIDRKNHQILPGRREGPIVKNYPNPAPCAQCGIDDCFACCTKHVYARIWFRQISSGGVPTPSGGVIPSVQTDCPEPPTFNWGSIGRAIIEAIPWVGGPINTIIDGISLGKPGGGSFKGKPVDPPKELKCPFNFWQMETSVLMDYQCYCPKPGPEPACPPPWGSEWPYPNSRPGAIIKGGGGTVIRQ